MSAFVKVTLPLTDQLPCGVHEWRKLVGGEKWNPTDWTGRAVVTRYRKVKTQDSTAIVVTLLLVMLAILHNVLMFDVV